jgi:PKHD-type hydroxylase
MTAWWQLWKGAWSAEFCERVIADALKLQPVQGTIGHGGDKSITDEGFRRSVIRWVPLNWRELRQELEEKFHEANSKAFGFDLASMREVQFTEYSEEQRGEYRAHEDNNWLGTTPYDRKLSLVVQLSDPSNYEGCNLTLAESPPNREELRTRGTVIVFPSFMRHGVTQVVKGTRFSLVAWMEGNRFR